MGEILAYAFMQRALLAALLVGILCSTVAFFAVLNRMAFLGAGISHAALGGIAIGLVTGLNPTYSGALFAVLSSLGSGYISKRGLLHEDTAIGIFYATGMALGIFLIGMRHGYHPELFSLLFGNILTVSRADLQLLLATTLLVTAFISLFFKELLALSFDEDAAAARGLPVGFLYYSLLVAMALAVVVSVRVVGAVLAAAMLVTPAATGLRLSRNYRGMLAISLLVGSAGGIAGLVLSCFLQIPTGSAIVLFMSAVFALAMLKQSIRQLPDERRRCSR